MQQVNIIKRILGVEFRTASRTCPVILADRCNSCCHRAYWRAYRINFMTSLHIQSAIIAAYLYLETSLVRLQPFSIHRFLEHCALLFVIYIAQDFVFKSKMNKIRAQLQKLSLHRSMFAQFVLSSLNSLVRPPIQAYIKQAFIPN